MLTPWGYEVDELPALVSVGDYASMTGRPTDTATESALDAASAAIRNLCGWHVAPNIECHAELTAEGRMVRVPARLLTAVHLVEDSGTLLTEGEFEAHSNGLLRRTCFKSWAKGWQAVKVDYHAGFELAACPDLLDIVMRIADGVSSIPMGVASETAGNVSISYSATASAVAAQQAQAYAPALRQYALVGAHAA
ncbi:MAG: hypothetical protein IJ087_19720 [Eggerthellaceae bacterium]|nr:hypothetical protein [Eggerthellaceae bacterium]